MIVTNEQRGIKFLSKKPIYFITIKTISQKIKLNMNWTSDVFLLCYYCFFLLSESFFKFGGGSI